MARSLTEITSQEILKKLPKDTIDGLLGEFYLPFLYRIENVFDNISCDGMVDKELLKSFCNTFPQFVHKSKRQEQKIGQSIKDSAFYFINDGIMPDKPGELYAITTYHELDPVVNNELIKFFISRRIPICVSLTIRKSHDQWEPLYDEF